MFETEIVFVIINLLASQGFFFAKLAKQTKQIKQLLKVVLCALAGQGF